MGDLATSTNDDRLSVMSNSQKKKKKQIKSKSGSSIATYSSASLRSFKPPATNQSVNQAVLQLKETRLKSLISHARDEVTPWTFVKETNKTLPVDTLQEAVDNIELNSDPTTFKDLCKILDVELPVLANELRLERKYETRDLDVCDDLEHLAGVVVRREYCSNRRLAEVEKRIVIDLVASRTQLHSTVGENQYGRIQTIQADRDAALQGVDGTLYKMSDIIEKFISTTTPDSNRSRSIQNVSKGHRSDCITELDKQTKAVFMLLSKSLNEIEEMEQDHNASVKLLERKQKENAAYTDYRTQRGKYPVLRQNEPTSLSEGVEQLLYDLSLAADGATAGSEQQVVDNKEMEVAIENLLRRRKRDQRIGTAAREKEQHSKVMDISLQSMVQVSDQVIELESKIKDTKKEIHHWKQKLEILQRSDIVNRLRQHDDKYRSESCPPNLATMSSTSLLSRSSARSSRSRTSTPRSRPVYVPINPHYRHRTVPMPITSRLCAIRQ